MMQQSSNSYTDRSESIRPGGMSLHRRTNCSKIGCCIWNGTLRCSGINVVVVTAVDVGTLFGNEVVLVLEALPPPVIKNIAESICHRNNANYVTEFVSP